ncbi:WD40 repeat domain-containing protein [Streptomyces sp. NPDC058469]|uniref:WD40 repeat domain-containing protein n=1 Tax=Streptomyces sp. NPDC058469 TaxID=3346514 RepID=UPI00364E1150
MNIEELVRDSLREQASRQMSSAPGFADRVLAVRRRRTRRLATVAAAAAAVIAVAVTVPLLDPGRTDVRPAEVIDGVVTHPDQWPPRDMVAAGRTALAAYYTADTVAQTSDRGVFTRTYWLLDPRTEKYKKTTKWSYVAVAPGMHTAAVLEQRLPAHRIGLLDLTTGKVERWIPVERGVGGVEFSHDGSRLVATTYDENPDVRTRSAVNAETGALDWTAPHNSTRSGFYVLDMASGAGSWSGVSSGREINSRQDFAFSRTGEQVYSQIIGGRDGLQQFYDLDGNEIAAPANERYLRSDVDARLSPDGRLAALGLTKEVGGSPGKSYSSISDPSTGKEITRVRGGTLLAWADDKRLIAWERTTSLEETYLPRLVLVTIGSDKVVPLSGTYKDIYKTYWAPVFAER